MATTELLCCCLEGTQNPALEIRAPAEQQLSLLSVQHGFGVALLEIFLSPRVSMQTRQLAAVLSRRFVHEHWSRAKPGFVEPEVSEEHRAHMRRQMLQGINIDDSKLCTAVGMCVATVAQSDFPAKWPELLPHLLGMLQSGVQQKVSAAMRCLVLVSEEMTEQQVPHIIADLFPSLYQIFISADQFSKGTRASACGVVYKAIKLASVSLLAADSPGLSEQPLCLEQLLPSWLEVFVQVIASPMLDESPAELCVRIEIVKIFSVIVEAHPRLLSTPLAPLVHALWQGLSVAVDLYEQRVVLDRSAPEYTPDPYDHYGLDGDRISVDALAWELMECLREVAAAAAAAAVIPDSNC